MPVKIVSDVEKMNNLKSTGDPQVISKSDYENGKRTFDSHFKIENIGSKSKQFPILKSEIDGLVAQLPTSDERDRAVIVIYHGYDKDKDKKELKRGLRVVTHSQSPQGDEWDITPELEAMAKLPSHKLVEVPSVTVDFDGDSNHPVYKLEQISNIKEWDDFQTDYYALTTRHLQPRTTTPGNFTNLDRQKDPKAVYFPYVDEIKELAVQNASQVPLGKDLYYIIADFASFIEVNNGNSRVDVARDGYYHSVSFHTGYIEDGIMISMLKDDSLVSTLINNGIDYGHICPPRCKKARLNQLKSTQPMGI